MAADGKRRRNKTWKSQKEGKKIWRRRTEISGELLLLRDKHELFNEGNLGNLAMQSRKKANRDKSR
jgi:hypothetical protein